jgi:hypothetical protein
VFFYRPVTPPEGYRNGVSVDYQWQEGKLRISPKRGSKKSAFLALVAMMLSSVCAYVAFDAYTEQFVPLVFASRTMQAQKALTLTRAGFPDQTFSLDSGFSETSYHQLKIRSKGAPDVRVFEAGKTNGFDRTFHLPTSSHGWLLAPDIASPKHCIVQQTVGYGIDSTHRFDKLAHEGDVYVFKQKPDYFFQEPNNQETVKSGELSTKKRLIRTVPCNE